MTTRSDLATVAMHLRLAAQAANVTDIRLMSVGRPCNLEPLADRLSELVGDDGGDALRIFPLHSDTYNTQPQPISTGLIVVTPSRLQSSDVEDVSTLLSISGWRFLGILPYTSPGILDRIFGTDLRSAQTMAVARKDAPTSSALPAFADAAPGTAAVEPNGDAKSHVAALAWRLEHPRHTQRG